MDICKYSSKLIGLSSTTYHTVVDSKLNDNGTKLNDIMKCFTIIQIIFIPFSLISGIWGMNVEVPW